MKNGEKKKRPWLPILVVVVVIAVVSSMFSSEPENNPFEEGDIIGKTVAEARDIFSANDYSVKVLSITGAELFSDLESIGDETANRWFISECEANHSNKSVEITVDSIKEDSTDSTVDNAEAADKTTLIAVIKNASGNDQSLYTEQTWAILETTIEAAQEVVDDEKATQEQIDAAMNLVTDAVSGLEEK